MGNRILWIVLAASLILAGCRPANPGATAPTATVENTAPAAVEASPSPVPPTETAVPPTSTPAPTPTMPPEGYGPDNFPLNVNPLTGLPVSNPDILERRPLSVKIQIFPRGQRPAVGVSLADLVFDYYQNNGMTRFHAIFYGQDAKEAGPIRSARLLDKEIVQMYKSVLAFGGADRRILTKLQESSIAPRLIMEGGHNCPPMCRVDPDGFNFLMTNTGELSNYATSQGIDNGRQNLNGMTFHLEAPQGGQAGQIVTTRYSISAYSRWTYDSATQRYLREQDTQEDQNGSGEGYAPMIDKLTNQQISASNVVVLVVPHQFLVRKNNAEIVEILLGGAGPAYAFRDGLVYQATWNRPTEDSVIYLTMADGTRYPFKPGNTWFEVIGQNSSIEPKGDGTWRFVSSIP